MLAACTGHSARPIGAGPITIEMWRGGDDGLTLAFWRELERALDLDGRFQRTHEPMHPAVVLTLETNVHWKMRGPRMRLYYSVRLDAGGSGRLQGACWEDQMDRCAQHIVTGTAAWVEESGAQPHRD